MTGQMKADARGRLSPATHDGRTGNSLSTPRATSENTTLSAPTTAPQSHGEVEDAGTSPRPPDAAFVKHAAAAVPRPDEGDFAARDSKQVVSYR